MSSSKIGFNDDRLQSHFSEAETGGRGRRHASSMSATAKTDLGFLKEIAKAIVDSGKAKNRRPVTTQFAASLARCQGFRQQRRRSPTRTLAAKKAMIVYQQNYPDG